MKKSQISPTFILFCIVVLVAVYGIAVCLQKIKISRAQAAESKMLTKLIQEYKESMPDTEQQTNTYVQARQNITDTMQGRNSRPDGSMNNNRTSMFSSNGRGNRNTDGTGRGGMMGGFGGRGRGGQADAANPMAGLGPMGGFGGGFDATAFGDPAAFGGMGGFGGVFDPTADYSPDNSDDPGVVDQQVADEEIIY